MNYLFICWFVNVKWVEDFGAGSSSVFVVSSLALDVLLDLLDLGRDLWSGGSVVPCLSTSFVTHWRVLFVAGSLLGLELLFYRHRAAGRALPA